MKVLAISERGADPAMLDVQPTAPGSGEVRVAVAASSINGFDRSIAAGNVWDHMDHSFPVVLGRDFVGKVDAVGEGVDEFHPGQLVAGVLTGMPLGQGGIGEYITVPASLLVEVPEDVTVEDAAAVGLAGISALDVIDAMDIKEGDIVLVSGASGGVGSFAVQLAKQRGARVIATARPGEAAQVMGSLGAEHSVNYSGDLAEAVRAFAPDGVDKVFHAAGDPAAVGKTLRPGGMLASLVGANADNACRTDITVIPVMAKPSAVKLAHLLEKLEVGRLQVHVATKIPLERATEAMAAFQAGKVGKVLVTR